MDERNSLAQRFEAARDHLHAIAWRILGSRAEPDRTDSRKFFPDAVAI